MNPFEFIILFFSFIYTLALTHLLFAWTRMIRHRRQLVLSWPHLLWMLVALGYLTQRQLEEALAIEARNRSIPLGQILQDMGVIEADVINAVMAKKMGIPYIDLQKFRISPEALKRVPPAVAQRYQILPVAETENSLVVAIEHPMNMA